MKNDWNEYEELIDFFNSETEEFESSETVHFERMKRKGEREKKRKRDWILKWRNRDWPSWYNEQLWQRKCNRVVRCDNRKVANVAVRSITEDLDTIEVLPAKKSMRTNSPYWAFCN